jgi:hypothetical protein
MLTRQSRPLRIAAGSEIRLRKVARAGTPTVDIGRSPVEADRGSKVAHPDRGPALHAGDSSTGEVQNRSGRHGRWSVTGGPFLVL